ncbi:transaldolase family protein [Dyadobacter sp. CY347]|uniref:transaldolase family protein n=1 Tax=Dyadobacter sp. CY347 TaxID=2909336 RepID=UPI002107A5CB|nr:transaldolase family protein [Dyadobacter sp. CY347]
MILARASGWISLTAGIIAIGTAISEGINVNVTLLFSLKRYEAVVEALYFRTGKKGSTGPAH